MRKELEAEQAALLAATHHVLADCEQRAQEIEHPLTAKIRVPDRLGERRGGLVQRHETNASAPLVEIKSLRDLRVIQEQVIRMAEASQAIYKTDLSKLDSLMK